MITYSAEIFILYQFIGVFKINFYVFPINDLNNPENKYNITSIIYIEINEMLLEASIKSN